MAFKEDVMRLALKTVSYGFTHIAVATAVAYVLTGNLTAAIGIGLIEPIIQTGVFTIHELLWKPHRRQRNNHLRSPTFSNAGTETSALKPA